MKVRSNTHSVIHNATRIKPTKHTARRSTNAKLRKHNYTMNYNNHLKALLKSSLAKGKSETVHSSTSHGKVRNWSFFHQPWKSKKLFILPPAEGK